MARDLKDDGLTRSRVLAAIVRLLDVGLFRIGGEDYAQDHGTFGVASLRKEHVHIHKGVMTFDYPAKGSIERTLEIRNAPACRVVASLLRRRSGGTNLFVYRQGRQWVDVHAHDVNAYIKDVVGEQFSAKDFRTWSATVLAAAALAEGGQRPQPRPVAGMPWWRQWQPLRTSLETLRPSVVRHMSIRGSSSVSTTDAALGTPSDVSLIRRSWKSPRAPGMGESREVEEAVLELLEDP